MAVGATQSPTNEPPSVVEQPGQATGRRRISRPAVSAAILSLAISIVANPAIMLRFADRGRYYCGGSVDVHYGPSSYYGAPLVQTVANGFGSSPHRVFYAVPFLVNVIVASLVIFGPLLLLFRFTSRRIGLGVVWAALVTSGLLSLSVLLDPWLFGDVRVGGAFVGDDSQESPVDRWALNLEACEVRD